MNVNCPTCKKSVEWNESQPYRPFCSKRCQMIDLGDWAEEQQRIPGKPAVDPDMLDDEQLEAFIQSLKD